MSARLIHARPKRASWPTQRYRVPGEGWVGEAAAHVGFVAVVIVLMWCLGIASLLVEKF